MAETTVFVDDAVRGVLPPICVKDGVPTGSRLRLVEEIGRSNRLGILWLFVFLGPLGWIVLLFLAGRSTGEELTVTVPFSDAAYARMVAARRLRWGAAGFGILGGGGLFALTGWAHLGAPGDVLAGAVVVTAIGAFLVASWQLGQTSVGVRLDASRRWVTLRSVHPAFAAACDGRAIEAQRA